MPRTVLTPKQQDILLAEGPFFIDANPGSGKTLTLSEHIKRMLSGPSGKPFLLLTFTNAAVDSFQSKLAGCESLDIDARQRFAQSRVLTFDSFINAYLARPIAATLWPNIQYRFVPSFERVENSRIQVSPKSKSTVNIQDFEPDGSYKGNKLRFKQLAEKPEFSEAVASSYREKFHEGVWSSKLIRAKLEELLSSECKSAQADTVRKLTKQLLWLIALRFPKIYIDEAQDCNSFEWHLLGELQNHSADVSIVGDKKQAIYGFRDESVSGENFRPFASHTKFELRRSFRSNTEICNLAEKFQSARLYSEIPAPKLPPSSPAVSIFTYATPEEYARKLNALEANNNVVPGGWTVLSHRSQTISELFGELPDYGQERDPAHVVYTQLLSVRDLPDKNVNPTQIVALIDSFKRLLPVISLEPLPDSLEANLLAEKGESALARGLATHALCNAKSLSKRFSRDDFQRWLQETVLAELRFKGSLLEFPKTITTRQGTVRPSLTQQLWNQSSKKQLPLLNVDYRGTIHSVKGMEFPKVSIVVGSWRPKGSDSLLIKVRKHRLKPGSDEVLNVAYVGITRAIHQVNLAFQIDNQNYCENTFHEELKLAELDRYFLSI
ncbi:UvrD-helicase domain-containing protein [Corynebacterium aurimucosum]|uniref:UvrD-helicase domain-containing protein n=1 Tax=Corynebacterium aurimucosum TaxID=169292 RepID=UPI0037570922